MNKLDFSNKFFNDIFKHLSDKISNDSEKILFINDIKKIFDKNKIVLWNFLYAIDTSGKYPNNKHYLDNNVIVQLWDEYLDWLFSIMLLDLDQNKTYYIICDYEKVLEFSKVSDITAKWILSILDNDINLFKMYMLKLLISMWMSVDNIIKVIFYCYNNDNKNLWNENETFFYWKLNKILKKIWLDSESINHILLKINKSVSIYEGLLYDIESYEDNYESDDEILNLNSLLKNYISIILIDTHSNKFNHIILNNLNDKDNFIIDIKEYNNFNEKELYIIYDNNETKITNMLLNIMLESWLSLEKFIDFIVSYYKDYKINEIIVNK